MIVRQRFYPIRTRFAPFSLFGLSDIRKTIPEIALLERIDRTNESISPKTYEDITISEARSEKMVTDYGPSDLKTIYQKRIFQALLDSYKNSGYAPKRYSEADRKSVQSALSQIRSMTADELLRVLPGCDFLSTSYDMGVDLSDERLQALCKTEFPPLLSILPLWLPYD